MRIKRATSQSLQSKLDRLKADIAAYRLEHRTLNVTAELRSRAVRLLMEDGLTQIQLGRAIGISSPTISRWLAKAGKEMTGSECRELVLIPDPPPQLGWPAATIVPQERCFLNLPNGLQFDLPLAALTVSLVTDLMTARRT